MSGIATTLNENDKQTRFGLAEGLLRVLARKMPDADLSDASLTYQMNAIANRLHQENLYDFDKENNKNLEYLIGLMQLADYVIDIAKNRHESKNILNLVDEIQTSDEEYSNIIDVMVLISKKEFKSSVQSLSYILAHSFQKPS